MDEVDILIAEFEVCEDKIEALDRIGAASGDDRAAKLYLSVSTSDTYDIATRQYAARLLRYAFPEATELQDAVVAAAVQFAADKGVEEALRLDFLEVILFSQRTYNTVKALVTLMADADDSPDVRRTAFDVLRRHTDIQMIRRAVGEVTARDTVFDDFSSRLLG